MGFACRSPFGNHGHPDRRTIQVSAVHRAGIHRFPRSNRISTPAFLGRIPLGRQCGVDNFVRHIRFQLAQGNPRVAQGNRSQHACTPCATYAARTWKSLTLARTAKAPSPARRRQVHAKDVIPGQAPGRVHAHGSLSRQPPATI